MSRTREQASNFRFGPILRDVAILWVLTGLGGFVAGFAQGAARFWALAVSNLFFITVGFVISGCLAIGSRWKHLAYVALFTWLSCLINVFFGLIPLEHWFLSILFIPLFMALGGGLSYVFKRTI